VALPTHIVLEKIVFSIFVLLSFSPVLHKRGHRERGHREGPLSGSSRARVLLSASPLAFWRGVPHRLPASSPYCVDAPDLQVVEALVRSHLFFLLPRYWGRGDVLPRPPDLPVSGEHCRRRCSRECPNLREIRKKKENG
jgi:hypothetical protein